MNEFRVSLFPAMPILVTTGGGAAQKESVEFLAKVDHLVLIGVSP